MSSQDLRFVTRVELSSCCRLCASHLDVNNTTKLFVDPDNSICTKIAEVIHLQVMEGDGLPAAICNICVAKLNYAHKFIEKSIAVDHLLRDILIQAKELVAPDCPSASAEVELVAEVKSEVVDDEAVQDGQEADEVLAEYISEENFAAIHLDIPAPRLKRLVKQPAVEHPNAQLSPLPTKTAPAASRPLSLVRANVKRLIGRNVKLLLPRPVKSAVPKEAHAASPNKPTAARKRHRAEHLDARQLPTAAAVAGRSRTLVPATAANKRLAGRNMKLLPRPSGPPKEAQAASSNESSKADKRATSNAATSPATKKGHINYFNPVTGETTKVALECTPLGEDYADARAGSSAAEGSASKRLLSRPAGGAKRPRKNRPRKIAAAGSISGGSRRKAAPVIDVESREAHAEFLKALIAGNEEKSGVSGRASRAPREPKAPSEPKGPNEPRPKNKVCEVCGKSYACMSLLRDHLRVHTGELPFACHLCGKAFPSRGSRHSHAAAHSDHRPHVCELCGSGFKARTHLNKHMLAHMREKPFRSKV